MLVVGGFYLFMAIERYNSPQHQLLAAFGGSDSALAWTTLYGLAGGIVGILLFTSEPSVF
jgi:hypothetical protein